ncbi:MAG: ImmA/IrrE family metallo-endopeptidase, partial [Clostridium sp.]
FPININEIISSMKDYKIKVLPYSTVMHKYNLTKEETFEMLTSKDGCTIRKREKYVIYYNDIDNEYPDGRIRWTIAHELGHIFCKHFDNKKTKISQDDVLSDKEYSFMEKEADYFASMFLSHSAVLSKINVNNPREIESFCDLSSEASINRFKNLKTWNKYNFTIYSDKIILRNFQNYIEGKINDYKEYVAFIQAFSL